MTKPVATELMAEGLRSFRKLRACPARLCSSANDFQRNQGLAIGRAIRLDRSAAMCFALDWREDPNASEHFNFEQGM